MPAETLSQEMVITVIIVALIAFFVGFFIGRAIGGNASTNTVSDAQKELDDYKAVVNQHFGKTADLVDNLTQSYKDVFDHLGTSAKSLLTEEQLQQHLEARADKAITLTYIEEDTASKTTVKASQHNPATKKVAEKSVAKPEEKAATAKDAEANPNTAQAKTTATIAATDTQTKGTSTAATGDEKNSADFLNAIEEQVAPKNTPNGNQGNRL